MELPSPIQPTKFATTSSPGLSYTDEVLIETLEKELTRINPVQEHDPDEDYDGDTCSMCFQAVQVSVDDEWTPGDICWRCSANFLEHITPGIHQLCQNFKTAAFKSKEKIESLEKRINDNLACWQVHEQRFITTREADLRTELTRVTQERDSLKQISTSVEELKTYLRIQASETIRESYPCPGKHRYYSSMADDTVCRQCGEYEDTIGKDLIRTVQTPAAKRAQSVLDQLAKGST